MKKSLKNIFKEISHPLINETMWEGKKAEEATKEILRDISAIEEAYDEGKFKNHGDALDSLALIISAKNKIPGLDKRKADVFNRALDRIAKVKETYAEAIESAEIIKAERSALPKSDWHSVFAGDLPGKDWGNDDGHYYCKATVYDALHNKYYVADAQYNCWYNHWAELKMGYNGSHTGERNYCDIPDNSTSRMVVAWMPTPKIKAYEPTMEEKRIIGALEWEQEVER